MDKNFEKFKKRVWFDILIKCLCFGLAAAAVAVVAVLLPCKLCGIRLLWVFYVLIAIGGYAFGAGISFLFLRTNDRKIARRLDSELNLENRVETAYVFSGQQSEMLDLQRVNASEALGGIALKALPFKNVVATILAVAIAVVGVIAVPVIATVVPAVYASTEEEEPPEEPPRDISDWEWAAFDDLVEYVRTSKKFDRATKSEVLTELGGLRNLLLDGVTGSSLKSFVEDSISNIRNAIKTNNSENDLTEEQQSNNTEEGNYVINKLYEIFDLRNTDAPGEGGDKLPGSEEGDENGGSGSGGSGGAEENLNNVPFFDPELGYVTISEAREKYYERVQAALDEGTISREEWEYIMTTYFADLMNKDQ